jgi:hypothetical protein
MGSVCDGISTQIVTQAQWVGGSFQNGVTRFLISLAAPAANSDAQIASDVAVAFSGLNFDISSNGAWVPVASATVYDVQAQPLPPWPVPDTPFPIL